MIRRPSYGVFLVVGLVAVAISIGVFLKPATPATAKAAPIVGHPAPQIALTDIHGRKVSLSDFRGHVVLVNFFATWCIPCGHEMPIISRAYRRHHASLRVLAVDEQEAASDVRHYVSARHLAFVPVLDPTANVWHIYRVAAQPVSFWVDARGTIRWIHYGAMSQRMVTRELHQLGAA